MCSHFEFCSFVTETPFSLLQSCWTFFSSFFIFRDVLDLLAFGGVLLVFGGKRVLSLMVDNGTNVTFNVLVTKCSVGNLFKELIVG